MTTMSEESERSCPLCAEEMDQTDLQLKPCKCGYELCVWCWHHIMDMAEKDDTEGRCPACRTPYDKDKIVGTGANCESRLSDITSEKKQRPQKLKSKSLDARKHLTNVRVIQRNLVYVVGIPATLADEEALEKREYFGQYGKVLKVSISRTAAGVPHTSNNTFSVYITYTKEEEAIRCINAVNGFTLEGKPLKAHFGTTKYCHAWLRNMPCGNPDCLYLHEVGVAEDSFTKDEVISPCIRNKIMQTPGVPSQLQRRSGNTLPPPLDEYCSVGVSISNKSPKISSCNAGVQNKSPPNSSSGRSSALPAGASWGQQRGVIGMGGPTNASCLPEATKSKSGASNMMSRSLPKNLDISSGYSDQALSSEVETDRTVPLEINVNQSPRNKETTMSEFSKGSRVDSSTLVIASNRQALPSAALQIEDIWGASGSNEKLYSHSCSLPSARTSDGAVSVCDSQPDPSDLSTSGSCFNGVGTRSHSSLSSGKYPSKILSGDGKVVSDMAAYESSDRFTNLSEELQDPTKSAVHHGMWEELCAIDQTNDKSYESSNLPKMCWETSNGSLLLDVYASQPMRESQSGFESNKHVLPRDIGAGRNGGHELLGNGQDFTNYAAGELTGHEDLRLDSFLSEHSSAGKLQSGSFARGNMDNALTTSGNIFMTDRGENNLISDILSMDFELDDPLTSASFARLLINENDNGANALKLPAAWKTQSNNQSRFSFAWQEDNLTHRGYDMPSRGGIGEACNSMRNLGPRKAASASSQTFGISTSNLEIMDSSVINHSPFSSSRAVSRPPVSAPPGFSAPSRPPPPPGFSSLDRPDPQSFLSHDIGDGVRSLATPRSQPLMSTLSNQYQLPVNIDSTASVDVEFIDPAIMAVSKGKLPLSYHSVLDRRPVQSNTYDNDPRIQHLMNRPTSARQSLRYMDPVSNGLPHFIEPQSNNLSMFSPSSHQQQTFRGLQMSNGFPDTWSGIQSPSGLGLVDTSKNGRVGFDRYFPGSYEDLKFRSPNSSDFYSRVLENGHR